MFFTKGQGDEVIVDGNSFPWSEGKGEMPRLSLETKSVLITKPQDMNISNLQSRNIPIITGFNLGTRPEEHICLTSMLHFASNF